MAKKIAITDAQYDFIEKIANGKVINSRWRPFTAEQKCPGSLSHEDQRRYPDVRVQTITSLLKKGLLGGDPKTMYMSRGYGGYTLSDTASTYGSREVSAYHKVWVNPQGLLAMKRHSKYSVGQWGYKFTTVIRKLATVQFALNKFGNEFAEIGNTIEDQLELPEGWVVTSRLSGNIPKLQASATVIGERYYERWVFQAVAGRVHIETPRHYSDSPDTITIIARYMADAAWLSVRIAEVEATITNLDFAP